VIKQRLIDANIILRFLTNDNPTQAAACENLLREVESGQTQVYLADIILADIVWTLEKYYRVEKSQIRTKLTQILALSGLRCVSKNIITAALDIYCDKNIDWTDAFVASQMLTANQNEIYSYDKDFDRIDGVKRIEP